MNIIMNNDIKTDKWKNLLATSRFSSPFQSQEFYGLFNTLDTLSADVFAIVENNDYKALVVITIQKESGIKGYFSRRGIVFGGPLVNSKDKKYLTPLLENIKKYYNNKLIFLEFRNSFDYSSFKEEFEQAGFEYNPWLNFHVDVTDDKIMQKSMSKSRLRQIKQAIKNGAQWKETQSVEDVNAFYSILKNLYDQKIKKPLLPKAFFLEHFKQKTCKFLLVYYNDKVIGGSMCPIIPEKVLYAFYICGLDDDYKDQRPSVMAIWGAMSYANQNNIPIFDFMGAGSPEDDYGVRVFKSRFGGDLVEHGRFIIIFNPILYKIGKLGLMIYRKIF